jgi:hypothetical protein
VDRLYTSLYRSTSSEIVNSLPILHENRRKDDPVLDVCRPEGNSEAKRRRFTMQTRYIPALVLTIGAGVAPVAMIASAADAASAPTCNAGKWTNVKDGLDDNRAYATCSAISSTTKVRAKLVRTLQSDITGSWFTTTNVTYYTAWATCPYGCSGGAEWAAR